MNPIAEEILMHYGMPRRSGRYPWGSGENPYQHSGDFLSRIDELKSQGIFYLRKYISANIVQLSGTTKHIYFNYQNIRHLAFSSLLF